MFGLDDWIAELAHGEALAAVLAVALLLGLRHASDPDHLAAVSTLIASEPEDGTRRAGRLGLAWGLGHADDARPVRPADRALPVLSARHGAARRGGARGADDHVPRGKAARALAARTLPRAFAPPRRHRAPPPAPARIARRPRPRASAGGPARTLTGPGVRDRPGARDGRIGRGGGAAARHDPRTGRGGGGAGGARARHGDLDGGPVLGVRLRDHPRTGAAAHARLRARDGVLAPSRSAAGTPSAPWERSRTCCEHAPASRCRRGSSRSRSSQAGARSRSRSSRRTRCVSARRS